MRTLHFVKAGRMLVADEGDYRYVLHSLPPGDTFHRWTAEVHSRAAKSLRKPLDKRAFLTKALAVAWLSQIEPPPEKRRARRTGVPA